MRRTGTTALLQRRTTLHLAFAKTFCVKCTCAAGHRRQMRMPEMPPLASALTRQVGGRGGALGPLGDVAKCSGQGERHWWGDRVCEASAKSRAGGMVAAMMAKAARSHMRVTRQM